MPHSHLCTAHVKTLTPQLQMQMPAMPGMQQQMPTGGMTGVTRAAYSNAEHKLFVRNLAFETTDQTLQMVFGAYGPIQEVRRLCQIVVH